MHGSELRTDWLYYSFSCNTVTLKAGKDYKLNFRRTWTVNTTNYYKISSYSNNAVANNIVTYYNKINESGYSTIQNHNIFFKMHDNYSKYYPLFLNGTARDQAFWYYSQDREAVCQTYQFPVSFNARNISFSLKKSGSGDGDVRVSICPMRKTIKGTTNMYQTDQWYNQSWDLGRYETTTKIAQSFKADSTVSSNIVLVPFSVTASLDGDIVLWVYEDDNNEIGTKIAETRIDAALLSLQTWNQRRKFIFDEKINYVQWENYWFVIEKDSPASSEYINVKRTWSKVRRNCKIYDNTNDSWTDQQLTMCYIIWDMFENSYYAPDLENKYWSYVIRNTNLDWNYKIINVDFGEDIEIPAFEEFAIVWEKTIPNNVNPYFNIITHDGKSNMKQGNKLTYQNWSWAWNADRDRYIPCGFADMYTYLVDQDIGYQINPSIADMQQVINVASKITDDLSYVKIRSWIQDWAITWGSNNYIPTKDVSVASATYQNLVTDLETFKVNDDWSINIKLVVNSYGSQWGSVDCSLEIYRNWALVTTQGFYSWGTTVALNISKWDIVNVKARSKGNWYSYTAYTKECTLTVGYQIYTPSSEERSGTVID